MKKVVAGILSVLMLPAQGSGWLARRRASQAQKTKEAQLEEGLKHIKQYLELADPSEAPVRSGFPTVKPGAPRISGFASYNKPAAKKRRNQLVSQIQNLATAQEYLAYLKDPPQKHQYYADILTKLTELYRKVTTGEERRLRNDPLVAFFRDAFGAEEKLDNEG